MQRGEWISLAPHRPLAASDAAPNCSSARGEQRRGPELRQARGERRAPELLLDSRKR
jgi:hypothetical protein